MIFFRLLTFFQSLFRKMLCDFTRNVFVQLYYFIQLYESYYASYSKPIRLSCTKSIEQKVVIKIEKWTRKLRFLNIHNQHWNITIHNQIITMITSSVLYKTSISSQWRGKICTCLALILFSNLTTRKYKYWRITHHVFCWSNYYLDIAYSILFYIVLSKC